MEIAIADREKTPMWYIVGTEIFLSYEEPGPITIDIQNLTPDQVNTIRNAASNKTLIVKGLEQLAGAPSINKPLGKSYATISPDVYKTAVAIPKELMPILKSLEEPQTPDGYVADKKKKIKALLSKPLYTAKKNLVGMNISELKVALEVELSDKCRKSVISIINDMITRFNGEVDEHITKNETDYTVKEKPLSPQLTDIEESNSESVKIDLGDTA